MRTITLRILRKKSLIQRVFAIFWPALWVDSEFCTGLLLVVQLTYTRETIRLLDERQISLAQATADSIATRYRNLGIIAEGFRRFPFPRSQLCCLAASTAENSAFCTCCIPASRKGPGTIRVIAFSRSSRTKYPWAVCFCFYSRWFTTMAWLSCHWGAKHFGFPRPGGLYPMRVWLELCLTVGAVS